MDPFEEQLWDVSRRGFDELTLMGPAVRLGVLAALLALAVAVPGALGSTIRRGQAIARQRRLSGRRDDSRLVHELRTLVGVSVGEWATCSLLVASCCLLVASFWRSGGSGDAIGAVVSVMTGAFIVLQTRKLNYAMAFAYDVVQVDRERAERVVERRTTEVSGGDRTPGRRASVGLFIFCALQPLLAALPRSGLHAAVIAAAALMWLFVVKALGGAAVDLLFRQRWAAVVAYASAISVTLANMALVGSAAVVFGSNGGPFLVLYLGAHCATVVAIAAGFTGRGPARALHDMTLVAAKKELIRVRSVSRSVR
ncbi:hypothetical protein [Promicromonospora sp. AC04]|uniref:hypothetical protein n=1 Tax=Promicromonospora sp. AC04 TaxID=2135723 RepID=UPI000D3D65CC|nr:hypothetical protein [Promicromonospora sp. AC04]